MNKKNVALSLLGIVLSGSMLFGSESCKPKHVLQTSINDLRECPPSYSGKKVNFSGYVLKNDVDSLDSKTRVPIPSLSSLNIYDSSIVSDNFIRAYIPTDLQKRLAEKERFEFNAYVGEGSGENVISILDVRGDNTEDYPSKIINSIMIEDNSQKSCDFFDSCTHSPSINLGATFEMGYSNPINLGLGYFCYSHAKDIIGEESKKTKDSFEMEHDTFLGKMDCFGNISEEERFIYDNASNKKSFTEALKRTLYENETFFREKQAEKDGLEGVVKNEH